jgi:aspartate aminotransferase
MSMADTAMPTVSTAPATTADLDITVTARPAATAIPARALRPGAPPAGSLAAGAPPAGSLAAVPVPVPVPVSATLAANEALAIRRLTGEAVLPLAFGEAGLPAHPMLRDALAAASDGNSYGPVAGLATLRQAAAGYWARRGLPTSADLVACGPGSKPLLFGLLLAIGTDVAVPRPSWVSYAAQASMIGVRPHFVPAPPGQGGITDPVELARAVEAAREDGRPIGSVIITLPDNPTGRLARPATIRELCEVAAAYDLIIISDEIYRDLVHDPGAPFPSPVTWAPERTVVTTSLSKSLALGGWRLGVARLPDSLTGRGLRDRLLGIGSEIWSAASAPIQEAAALAFTEPRELTQRIARSRSLHATVAREVAGRFAAAGLLVPAPQAAFYLYPDFAPWREHLRARHGITGGAGLARHLLDRYAMGVLPASAFGEEAGALRMRVATGLLYGDSAAQRERALAAAEPLALPWIAAALARIEEILADLAP